MEELTPCTYDLTEDTSSDGMYVIEVMDGDFKGTRFYFGALAFDEKEEGVMHYEITVEGHDGIPDGFKPFADFIITDLLTKAVQNNEVVYKGGV